MDLTDSSGDIEGNVIADEYDNCRMEVDASDKKDAKMHKPPSDWTKPDTQHERDEPVFGDVDNPGNWPQYYYRTRFDGGGNRKKLSTATIASQLELCLFQRMFKANAKQMDGNFTTIHGKILVLLIGVMPQLQTCFQKKWRGVLTGMF